MGPYELGGDWSDKGISGADRFVQRSYELFTKFGGLSEEAKAKDKYEIDLLSDAEKTIYRKVNQTIKRLDEEIDNFRFNTAIAAMMELINELKNLKKCSKEIQLYTLERFAILLAPLAPHLAEECWQILGNGVSIFEKPLWFAFDEKALIADKINIAVQVNGKLRDTIPVAMDSEQSVVKAAVMKNEKVIKHFEGKQIVKEIFVKNRIYNIVVR
jgi:leucyl-tRNA synthetase